MTFPDFFHDLFDKFSKTLGLVVTIKISLVLVYFFTINSSTDQLWGPPNCVPFALFNYSSLSYIVHALSSAVTKLKSWKIKVLFGPGLENKILEFHDFQGFPRPVRTLYSGSLIGSYFLKKKYVVAKSILVVFSLLLYKICTPNYNCSWSDKAPVHLLFSPKRILILFAQVYRFFFKQILKN